MQHYYLLLFGRRSVRPIRPQSQRNSYRWFVSGAVIDFENAPWVVWKGGGHDQANERPRARALAGDFRWLRFSADESVTVVGVRCEGHRAVAPSNRMRRIPSVVGSCCRRLACEVYPEPAPSSGERTRSRGDHGTRVGQWYGPGRRAERRDRSGGGHGRRCRGTASPASGHARPRRAARGTSVAALGQGGWMARPPRRSSHLRTC